jgi:galactokinase
VRDPGEIAAGFRERFGGEPRLFHAPGRVNLIGEHTDYNEGFVLPIAIDRGTLVAARARGDRILRVHSMDTGETAVADLDGHPPAPRGLWVDYVEGVARTLESGGTRLPGADLLLAGDVPIGAGLSSSASLELSVGLALASLAGIVPDPVALALAGQAAEHRYVGARVGIMDQLVSALGVGGRALLIDCRSLAVRPVALDAQRASVVVCDSGVKHSLAGSQYNRRRRECEEAVAVLARSLPGIRALRDVTPRDLAAHGRLLPSLLLRRASHVVRENARTLEAADALDSGDLELAGRLMQASHASLRDLYEVSSPELDLLASTASSVPGVWGARMTGGGFGGATVQLVRPEAVDAVTERLREAYARGFGREPSVWTVAAARGAYELGVGPFGP